MKTISYPITVILAILLLLFIMAGCREAGEIQHADAGIKIDGKEYKFVKYYNGYQDIWLMVPVDAKVEVPQGFTWVEVSGKSHITRQSFVIK